MATTNRSAAMTGNSGRDDSRRNGDALDRVIDDALETVLRGGPGDLRARVLARLDESVDERPSRMFRFLRPAMLPVAGVLLIVGGVALGWWRVDGQLSSAGAGQSVASTARAGRPRPSSTVAAAGRPSTGVPAPSGETSAVPAGVAAPAGRERRAASPNDRIFASSWLDMDALSRPKGIAADSVTAGDDDSDSILPGAVAGDLGDPIRPIPRLRLIAIPPILTAPIADAPPISTLAEPAGTLSGDNNSRGRTDPGKPGGVRP
jgi:hypothetical protein